MTSGNRRQAGGAHVASSVSGQGPVDLSTALERHRQREAGPTQPPAAPPGNWPKTVGRDPDAPCGVEKSTPFTGDPLTSATPFAYTAGSQSHPNPNY